MLEALNRVPELMPAQADAGGSIEDAYTTRVSVSSTGSQGNDESYYPSVSEDGSYVAFGSRASGLVPGDLNGEEDIFLHEADTGDTRRLSEPAGGGEANGGSYHASISADGRYVAFASSAFEPGPGRLERGR